MDRFSAPTTRIDIAGDAAAADPWPLLAEIHAAGGIALHETFDRWFVASDRAARKILADFRRFTVEDTTVADLFGADAFISIDDRRRHDDLRNLWAATFRQQGLARLLAPIRRVLDDLLDPVCARLRAGEAVDVTDAICRPLPTIVIAMMMGVPDEAIPAVVHWSDEMAAGAGTYLSPAEKAAAHARRDAAKTGLADYLKALLRERRAGGAEDDLVATLARSDAGRALGDDQLVQNLRQLLFAGNETTAKWLAHIFVTFTEHPEVVRTIADDRSLVPAANDEVMRWQAVVGTLVRRVRGGPVEIAGVTMADGDDVTLLLGAANRDPARYADPDRFDIRRVPQPNLGFGVGFHNCLGSVLAKLEAELVVNGLLDRLDGWAMAAPHGYSSVPLRGPLPVVVAHAAAG